MNRAAAGHGAALLTVFVWGLTFISTKVLLAGFEPVEILFTRFLMGLLALCVVSRKRLPKTTWRQELLFAAAGLTGVCLYFLLENIALTFTQASNVGVIAATAPFFTAIFSRFFFKEEERLRPAFLLGFVIAMAGIALITVQGAALQLNPVGDLLALLSIMVWALYSNLTRKASAYGYPTVLLTRRIFFYGVLFILPILLMTGHSWDLARFTQPLFLGNLLFLGLGASACCFVTWNYAVQTVGAVKTSVYLYLEPVITVVFSVIILHETITPGAGVGIALTLGGLILSEYHPKKKVG